MKVVYMVDTYLTPVPRPDSSLRDRNHLTIGKVYDVTEQWGPLTYRIVNDSGTAWTYDINMFITLDEYRQRQIDKIIE